MCSSIWGVQPSPAFFWGWQSHSSLPQFRSSQRTKIADFIDFFLPLVWSNGVCRENDPGPVVLKYPVEIESPMQCETEKRFWGANGSSAQFALHPISAYFVLPHAELFLLLLFAFTEEIIFRGLLQPAFIQRYGVMRGIFLLSIVFATAHLDGDFTPNLTDALVIFRLFVRLCAAIPLSFITGWISLRTGSVLPAIVAHGLLNISGESPLGPRLRHMGLLLYLLWSVLAYLLFRFWPVAIDSSEPKSNSSTSPHI
jgi:hypothetical protein